MVTFFNTFFISRISVVVLVTRLQAGRSGVRIPVEARDFSLLQKRIYRLWGPPSILFHGYRGCFPGLKRPGRVVNHSPAPEWSNTLPYMSSRRGKGKFSFFLYNSCLLICLLGLILYCHTNCVTA
jgi:hypothetical protein